MAQEDGRLEHRADTMKWPERLARVGFRIAFAGSLVLFVALVVPEWRPTGVLPSIAQQFLLPTTAQSGPNCGVDSCNGRARLGGFIYLWVLYVAILGLSAASQAFRRESLDTAPAPQCAVFGLLLGLGVLGPVAVGSVSSIIAPSDTGIGGQLVPNWSVLADSLLLVGLAGLLLVTIGNALAVVGLLRLPQAVRVDWNALR